MAEASSRSFTSGGLAGPLTTNLPQPRDVAIPDFTSNTYAPFNITVTGALANSGTWLSIWSPRETRFVLRGGYIHVLCTTTCAGVADVYGELGFYDDTTGGLILPITSYHDGAKTPAGWVNWYTPWHFDLGKGYRSLLKNNRLLIGGTKPIGVGAFLCQGLVWGVQDNS